MKIILMKIKKVFFYVLIYLVLIVQVYPIFWMIITSLKSQEEWRKNIFSIPSSPTLENYYKVLSESNIPRYFMNSIIITVVALVLIAVLSSMAGFIIEKINFKINKVVMTFFLLGIMIPIQVTLLPLFLIYHSTNLLNTHWALILPQVGFALPISIYLFTAFYKYVPNEILESAAIDGCSIYGTFFKVVLPISKNTFITVITMNVIFIWNEYIFANTFISDSLMKTIPVGLQDFKGEYGVTNWGLNFAAIVITVLPVLIMYFILNKQVVAGMAAGAIKE